MADDGEGARTTEERAFRLLGLSWARRAAADHSKRRARNLLATQRADGGWTQLDERQLTDAYATGEALVALRESGADRARPIPRTAEASSICCARRSPTARGSSSREPSRSRPRSRAAFRARPARSGCPAAATGVGGRRALALAKMKHAHSTSVFDQSRAVTTISSRGGMLLDQRACDRARRSRDARFDGRFFIAVTTTRVYCRPICPARAPKDAHVRYFATAAAAEAAGFRPCLALPARGVARHARVARHVERRSSRALRLIADGALDDESVDAAGGSARRDRRHLRSVCFCITSARRRTMWR